MNNYIITQGEILIEMPNYCAVLPVSPDAEVEIHAQQEPGYGALPNLRLGLYRKGVFVGESFGLSAGHCCRASEAQKTFFIEHFFIECPEQGKGLGRYMMQALLWEMKKIGYENATTTVDVINPRAQLFYTNMGYQTVDTSYIFFKDMKNEIPLPIYKKIRQL